MDVHEFKGTTACIDYERSGVVRLFRTRLSATMESPALIRRIIIERSGLVSAGIHKYTL